MFEDSDYMICGMSKTEYDDILHELSTTGDPLVAKSFERSHTDTPALDIANLDIVYGPILDATIMEQPLPLDWHKRKRFSDLLRLDTRDRPVTSRQHSWTPSDPLKSSSSPEAVLFADEHEINNNFQQSISPSTPDKHYRKSPESNTGVIVYPRSGSFHTPQQPASKLSDSSDSEAESLVKEFGRHDISNGTTNLAQRQREAQLRSAPPKARNIVNRQPQHSSLTGGSRITNFGSSNRQQSQSQSPTSNDQCDASQTQIRDSDTRNSVPSASTPTSINQPSPAIATIKNESSSPLSQTKSAPRTQSSLKRKASLEGRGRKLFTVQIETDSQLHKYPVHEYDDPAMLAREIHVKFKDNIVFRQDWRACIIELWERKIQRLAEKDQTKKVDEMVST